MNRSPQKGWWSFRNLSWYLVFFQRTCLHETPSPEGAEPAGPVFVVGDGVRLAVRQPDVRQLHLRQKVRASHSDHGRPEVRCAAGHRWTSRIREALWRRKRSLLGIQGSAWDVPGDQGCSGGRVLKEQRPPVGWCAPPGEDRRQQDPEIVWLFDQERFDIFAWVSGRN